MDIVTQDGFITVTFDTPLDNQGTSDVASYAIGNLGGGVPVVVLAVDVFERVGDHVAMDGSSWVKAEAMVAPAGQALRSAPRLSRGRGRSALRHLKKLAAAPIPSHAVTGVRLHLSKPTDGKQYTLAVRGLKELDGTPYREVATFVAVAARPTVVAVKQLDEDQVVVTFSDRMRIDAALLSPKEYAISGPTTVRIKSVRTLVGNQVVLSTVGLGPGEYTLEVNAIGTPHDVAGNPMSGSSNQAVFAGHAPRASRSIFTDRGPISKPALTLQTGLGGAGSVVRSGSSQLTFVPLNARTVAVEGLAGVTPASVGRLLIVSDGAPENVGTFLIKALRFRSQTAEVIGVVIASTTGVAHTGLCQWAEHYATGTMSGPAQLTLPTANIKASHVGLYVAVSGSGSNDGAYRITSRVSPTVVKVAASFTLTDPMNGTLAWSLIDYRDGQIADDPSDVVVRVNSVQVTPEAVLGLLGQVVLSEVPDPADDVKIDYAWISNPVVDVRRLNSVEFRLNNWNREHGRNPSRHKYRYNNSLVRPDKLLAMSREELTGTATFSGLMLSDPSANFMTSIIAESYVTITSGANSGVRRTIKHVASNTMLVLDALLPTSHGGTYRIDPIDIRAGVAQPMQRDLKYRAYERAYSVALNNPRLLLLNSPNHRIAYPPMSRPLKTTFVNYQGSALPEVHTNPWQRAGQGSVVVSGTDLIVHDDSASDPIFWTRHIDLTFDHVFALAWRIKIEAVSVFDGIFTGVVGGYSDGEKVCVIGFLEEAGVKTFGILRRGFGNDPSTRTAWIGGIDGKGNSTFGPAPMDWNILRGYRIFRDREGVVSVYVDGAVVATLRARAEELPFLSELNAPFDQLQGPFFGSLSKEAESRTRWSFVRYTAIPVNPLESEPSIFVSYEGSTAPESGADPWTPVGFHGTETLTGTHLVLDSTSATDLASSDFSGLIGGDFRGYTRIEPLLRESYDTVLDVQLAVRTHTQGITPNAVMAAIDDGERLMQLCFFSDQASPKFSYGGRLLPQSFAPYSWVQEGSQTASMVGQYLRIADASSSDGLLYTIEDTAAVGSAERVLGYDNDYIIEFRVRVVDYTPDPASGFCGVMSSVYDSERCVGVQFIEDSGERYLELHSEGVALRRFAFEWDDGDFHTIRLVKSTVGNLVTLFGDNSYLGSLAYSEIGDPVDHFRQPAVPSLVGKASFGSATPLGVAAISESIWAYANYWRVTNGRRFVGLWKGFEPYSLLGYHLPISAAGRSAGVSGNVLTDPLADFEMLGVVSGDQLIVDEGPNKGVYTVSVVAPQDDVTKLTVAGQFLNQPSRVDYRCVKEVDWTTEHRFRVMKDPGGVSVFMDSESAALINADYRDTSLPRSVEGLPYALCAGLPSICWGAFDPSNLSQSAWDFVRFGAVRSLSANGIAPHHQVLNQRNVIASYEHRRTNIPHRHTGYWSESEGIPPQTEPDLLRDPNLVAFTLLNERTPLVPSTQTYAKFVVQLPDDILYNSLQVIERATGEGDLLAPFDDGLQPSSLGLGFVREVCLSYDGSVLPENDTTAQPRWTRVSDHPEHQSASVSGGVLTYGTDAVGTRTMYRNPTRLPDATSLRTEVKFRLRLLQDTSEGLGDSQVRVGFSSPGATVGLAFVTTPGGERYVLAVDMNNGRTMGGIPFDFYDGDYHTYVLSRDPGSASIQIRVES